MWIAWWTYPSLVSTCTLTVFIIRKKEITYCNVSSQNFISKVAFCKHTHKCYKHKFIGILDSKENKGNILYWFFLHEKKNKCGWDKMYSKRNVFIVFNPKKTDCLILIDVSFCSWVVCLLIPFYFQWLFNFST